MSTSTYRPGRPVAAVVQPRLVITPRGRRALLALALAIGTMLLVALVGGGIARGDEASQATVVVREGDTLDSIAAEYLPDTPRFDAIMMINRANYLNSTHVQTGRTLVIPREG